MVAGIGGAVGSATPKDRATVVPASQESKEGSALWQEFITNSEMEITVEMPEKPQVEELVKVLMNYWKSPRMATKVKFEDIEAKERSVPVKTMWRRTVQSLTDAEHIREELRNPRTKGDGGFPPSQL